MNSFVVYFILITSLINILAISYVLTAPAYTREQKLAQFILISIFPFIGAMGISYFLWQDRRQDKIKRKKVSNKTRPITKQSHKINLSNIKAKLSHEILSRIGKDKGLGGISEKEVTRHESDSESIYKPYDPLQYAIDAERATTNISEHHKPWVKRTWFIINIALPYVAAYVFTIFYVTDLLESNLRRPILLFFWWIVVIVGTTPYIIIWNKKAKSSHAS